MQAITRRTSARLRTCRRSTSAGYSCAHFRRSPNQPDPCGEKVTRGRNHLWYFTVGIYDRRGDRPMPLHLDILDVGQGDGMVVWLPNGKVMMVDLGSTRWKGLVTEDSFEYLRENTPFKNPGVTLEWLVATHGDSDHYNMVEEFLDTFQVNIRNVLHGGLRTEYGKLIGNLGKRKNSDGTLPTIQTGVHKGFFPLAPTEDLGAGRAQRRIAPVLQHDFIDLSQGVIILDDKDTTVGVLIRPFVRRGRRNA